MSHFERFEVSPDTMIHAAGVRKSFGPLELLKGVELTVTKGSVACIIGPSGSGKSTFLRCINQLEAVSDGSLWVNGELLGFRQSGNKLHELSEKQIARQRLASDRDDRRQQDEADQQPEHDQGERLQAVVDPDLDEQVAAAPEEAEGDEDQPVDAGAAGHVRVP